MKMNTDHLGYKLISGKLKERRVHSEQLNKFVAGFFDADGTVSISVDKKTGTVGLVSKITQSSSNDEDYELIRAIQDFYQLGKLNYYEAEEEGWHPHISWRMSTKESKMLFNRIGKYLFIKQDHFLNMIAIQEGYKGQYPSSKLIASMRENSREQSPMRARGVKHLSPAYLAGLIAGDGHVDARFNKAQRNNKTGEVYHVNLLSITIELNNKDERVLHQLATDFGGYVNKKKSRPTSRWNFNLGKNNKNAMKFTSKLMSYMCMQKKYDKLEAIYNFHKQLAETKRESP